MTEDQLEQETLGWLCEQGYTHLTGRNITATATTPSVRAIADVI